MTREHGRPGRRRAIAMAVAGAVLAGSLVACVRANAKSGPGAAGHGAMPSTGPPSGELVQALFRARAATIKYATSLSAAQADGYKVITPMMPDMGVHYLNPDIDGFDITRPAILVYVGRGDGMHLAALEWVFPQTPATPPLPGATYGSFDAACHYADGAVIAGPESSCQRNHPMTNAPFFFWHPKLVTLHVWLWYPNPEGLFHGTNPLVRPYT